jgi:TRAP-type mannitol/chloroaromatic compound transport system permease small subunit
MFNVYKNQQSANNHIVGSVFGPIRFLLPVCQLLIFIHIEHICSFFIAFFSATIDGRNLIFGHKLHPEI